MVDRVDFLNGRARVSLSELSDWELQVVREFIEWMWDNLGKWLNRYREEGYEGYDPRVQRLYLQRDTLWEFVRRVAELNCSELKVKRLLARLGILMYKENGGVCQYVMSVRVRKDKRKSDIVSVSAYVVDVEWAIEVGDELRDEIVRRERVRELKESEVSRIQITEPDDLPF